MGIGTIVGSAIFNLLGVGAIGSLAAIAVSTLYVCACAHVCVQNII